MGRCSLHSPFTDYHDTSSGDLKALIHVARIKFNLESPLSESADGRNIFTAMTAPADVRAAAEIIAAMKDSLGNLGKTFDSLGEQTVQMVKLGGELETAKLINSVRKDMQDQDQKHEAQIEEIKDLLQEVLEADVVDHLKNLIKQQILEDIGELVKQQVAEQLPHYIPQELQDEVATYQRQLQEVERALHNSESRRINIHLRTSQNQDRLCAILKSDGAVSPLFPRTLNELFSMNDATAKRLMREYELEDISESRERNVNRFMQFCGVSYQLVPSTPGAPSSGQINVQVVTQNVTNAGL